jgi:hypothetical protein
MVLGFKIKMPLWLLIVNQLVLTLTCSKQTGLLNVELTKVSGTLTRFHTQLVLT